MSEQQSVEQRVISDLFSRIQQAEAGSGPRDAEAERLIQECIAKQPSAPYYMAQAMLVQEAAIKRLNDQVNALQQQVTQLQSQPRQSSGGFLAGLFGGGSETRPTSSPNSGSQPIMVLQTTLTAIMLTTILLTAAMPIIAMLRHRLVAAVS